MEYSVYIIQSEKTGRWYYGYSTDLPKRLEGHTKGLNKSTRLRGPWRYIFVRRFNSKAEALHFELYLKGIKNKTYIRDKFSEYFVNDGV